MPCLVLLGKHISCKMRMYIFRHMYPTKTQMQSGQFSLNALWKSRDPRLFQVESEAWSHCMNLPVDQSIHCGTCWIVAANLAECCSIFRNF